MPHNRGKVVGDGGLQLPSLTSQVSLGTDSSGNVIASPSGVGGAAPFIIGGDSISQICYGSQPITPSGGTLAQKLANRADVLNGSNTTATCTNISSGFAHWMEALSGGRCQLIKNAGITGSTVSAQLAAYQNASSPYYCGDLLTTPPAFWIQQGAGGDDNGVSSAAVVETNLQAIYALFGKWFPQAKGIAWTQTPVNPNDDLFRRPINQWLRAAAMTLPVTVCDAERVMMTPKTGFVYSNPGAFTVTLANPAVFTTAVAHGFSAGDIVMVMTSGTLPASVVAFTAYYVIATGLTSTQFQLSATLGGAGLNTNAQSQTNTGGTQHQIAQIQAASGTQFNPRISGDNLHQNAAGAYDLAKMMLEVIGDRLPHENNMVNDYFADQSVQSTIVVTANTHTSTAVDWTTPAMPVGISYSVTGSGIPASTFLTITGAGLTGTLTNAATTTLTGTPLTLVVGGWGLDAMMQGTVGVGNTATNWNTSAAGTGSIVSLIPRDDPYGNWQRLQVGTGLSLATQSILYRFGSTAFPAGAIIQLECEVRWPFADLYGCTDIVLSLQTSGGSACSSYQLTSAGQAVPLWPYRTPPPGERWVLQTTPVIVPAGGITGQTYGMGFTALQGTIDIGRFSVKRLG